jgi:hypothetical protein
MSGKKAAVLEQLQLLDIHGTYYYDLVYRHLDDNAPRRARIGREDIYNNPQPGDQVQVHYLMNVVTSVEASP